MPLGSAAKPSTSCLLTFTLVARRFRFVLAVYLSLHIEEAIDTRLFLMRPLRGMKVNHSLK